MRKAGRKPAEKPSPKILHDVIGECPYCASKLGLPVAMLGVALKSVAASSYFLRLRKSEELVLEFAGVVKAVLRGRKILERWLVDSGFVDSAL